MVFLPSGAAVVGRLLLLGRLGVGIGVGVGVVVVVGRCAGARLEAARVARHANAGVARVVGVGGGGGGAGAGAGAGAGEGIAERGFLRVGVWSEGG